MTDTTKKQWIVAYSELAEEPKNFKTAAAAREAFETLAAEMGVEWDTAAEGDVFFVEPELTDEQIAADPHLAEEPAEEQDTTEPAEEQDETTPPAPAEQPAPKSGGKTATHADLDIVRVLVPNPKRPGSDTHARFALYQTGATVKEFLDAGGRRVDLRWDVDHKFIAIVAAADWVAEPEAPAQTQEPSEEPAAETDGTTPEADVSVDS